MLMKAWLTALQRQLHWTSRSRGLSARRKTEAGQPNRLVSAERLEDRALLTALVVDAPTARAPVPV